MVKGFNSAPKWAGPYCQIYLNLTRRLLEWDCAIDSMSTYPIWLLSNSDTSPHQFFIITPHPVLFDPLIAESTSMRDPETMYLFLLTYMGLHNSKHFLASQCSEIHVQAFGRTGFCTYSGPVLSLHFGPTVFHVWNLPNQDGAFYRLLWTDQSMVCWGHPRFETLPNGACGSLQRFSRIGFSVRVLVWIRSDRSSNSSPNTWSRLHTTSLRGGNKT